MHVTPHHRPATQLATSRHAIRRRRRRCRSGHLFRCAAGGRATATDQKKRPMRSDRLMPPIRRQRVVTATGRWKAGRPRRWLPPGSVRRRMKHPTNGFDCVLLVRRLMLDRPGPGTDESTFATCRPFFWGRPASRSNQISGRRPRAAAASP